MARLDVPAQWGYAVEGSAIVATWAGAPGGAVLVKDVEPATLWEQFVNADAPRTLAPFLDRFGPLHPDYNNGGDVPLADYATWRAWHRAVVALADHAAAGTRATAAVRPHADTVSALCGVAWSGRVHALPEFVAIAVRWWFEADRAPSLAQFAGRVFDASRTELSRATSTARRTVVRRYSQPEAFPVFEVTTRRPKGKQGTAARPVYRLVPYAASCWAVLGLGLLAKVNGKGRAARPCAGASEGCERWVTPPDTAGRPPAYCLECQRAGIPAKLAQRRHRSKHKRPASP